MGSRREPPSPRFPQDDRGPRRPPRRPLRPRRPRRPTDRDRFIGRRDPIDFGFRPDRDELTPEIRRRLARERRRLRRDRRNKRGPFRPPITINRRPPDGDIPNDDDRRRMLPGGFFSGRNMDPRRNRRRDVSRRRMAGGMTFGDIFRDELLKR